MKNKFSFSKLKQGLTSFYKKNKNLFFACLICCIGIVFLFVSSLSSLNKKSNNKTKATSSISITEYADNIEKKLVNIISSLSSVKNASAFVMVESTPTISYLTEKNETTITDDNGAKTEITTTVVFEKNGSISTPVVVTTLMPKITGVLIITNKINASTKLSIINSISIVLNVDESCISLLQES